MAQPPPYVPVHSFVSDSAILANFPGQALDVEFQDVKTTTDAIRVNLALIQRDDGALANGTVSYDTLSAALQTNGLAPANAWATATAYLAGNSVVQSSALYRCLVAHTAGTFATDLAAGKWTLVGALIAGPTGAAGAAGSNGVAGTNGTNGTNGINGFLTNTRLAKTGAYAVVNVDKGATIALGGSAFYTLTFNGASSYDATFAVVVLNEDTTRGKTIACNGLASFILWPGQSVILFNQNNVWKIFGASRWKLTTGITIFVDPVNGLDTNDGLAAGAGNAVLTMFQAACIIGQAQIDAYAASSPQITIQLADGTHTGGLHYPGPLVGGAGNAQVLVQGNASTPSNVIVQGDGVGGSPFSFFDYAVVELKNMKLQDTAASLIQCETGAVCRLEGGIIFGQTGSGQAHMFVRDNGTIIADVGYTISATAAANNGYHILAIDRAYVKIQGATITFSASVTFNTTIAAQRFSNVNAGAVTWTLGAFTVTGKRFQADDLSMISVFGAGVNAIPGTVAGGVTVGGQCA